jgi:putative hydrolase of the HAD superfamily
VAIRVVLFDVAGTLVRTRGSVGEQYAGLARRFGVEARAADLDPLFPAAFRAAPPMAFPGAPPEDIPARERAVWEGLVRGLFARCGLLDAFPPGRFAAYFAALYAHFETEAAWEVFPDVIDTLAAVRGLGLGLGVVTNFDGRVVGLLGRLGLAGWFDGITLSSRAGAAKPDPAIFRHALAQHSVRADEALHVGDSPAEDLAGARGAGLRAVLLDRHGRHRVTVPEARVGTLDEIVRFL